MSVKKLVPIKTPTRIGFLGLMGDVQGCGIIRVITPYTMLPYVNIKDLDIRTTYMSNFVGEINFYKNFSFVQFQRSATKSHLELFKYFKTNVQPKVGIPAIYEIDDLLMDIPEWNFAHHYYKINQPYIEEMLRNSNGIVASTHYLKKIYNKYNKNITVVPNHLPNYIWGDIEPKHLSYNGEKVKILWAGSQNHFKHKALVSVDEGGDFGNEFMDFIKKTVDKYEWHFMGAMPVELEDIKDKLIFHNWVDTWHYPKYVKSIKADIGLALLEDNTFNRCKSNIKCLEYTACGIPGIYSNVEPYKFMTTKVNNDEQLISKIEELASSSELRGKIRQKDYDTVKSQLWWEENDNLKKYVNSYLGLMGRKLP